MSNSARVPTVMKLHCKAMRLMSVFVGFWMVMLPQMVNASALATADDFGSRPAPINEEEEIKHLNLFELVVMGKNPHAALDRSSWTRKFADSTVLAPHGEVPHPPPWCTVR